VAPSGESWQGKGPLDQSVGKKTWRRLFLAAYTLWAGLNLVVAVVLRDSLCLVSLLPCVADCCMLYTVCKVEQFVLTILKENYNSNNNNYYYTCRAA